MKKFPTNIHQTVPDGPSFGVAPSGKWRWIRLSLKNDSYSVPRTIFRATVYEMSDDSFITSFILPVTLRPPLFLGHQEVIFVREFEIWFRRPLPLSFSVFTTVDSTYNADPPIDVQARPATVPGGVVSYILSLFQTARPTKSFKLSTETETFSPLTT